MHLRSLIAALAFVLPALASAQANGLSFWPAEPSTSDFVTLESCYLAGAFVETVEISRTEGGFVIRFVQDGFDFSPNPLHCAVAELGQLAAGTYEVIVIRDSLISPPTQDELVLVVSPAAPQALPSPLTVPLSPLALLFILVGVVCGARRAVHNCAFKPTAGDAVRFERVPPASGGLTRR